MKKSFYRGRESREWLEGWLADVFKVNNLNYKRLNLSTSLSSTKVLAKNHDRKELEPLIFLPGGRTCGIFWDINNNLAPLYAHYRIYLVDVNGQPGLSDGNVPLISSDGYGIWLKEVLTGLDLNEATFIGASFGGSLIAKLAEVDAKAIKKAFLCNPAGFANISFNPKNLYYLIAPLVLKSPKSVEKFLDNIIFHKDFEIDSVKRGLIVDFLRFTNKNFVMQAENPRPFPDEVLSKLTAPAYLMLDRDDVFINQKKTYERAKKVLPNLVETVWLEKHGHGIELSNEVVAEIEKRLE
ncbi:MAG: alpha/beta hydrolase [Pyrinomonadaceae bacterium]